MMYHVVKCDDCGFTMTVPWNVARTSTRRRMVGSSIRLRRVARKCGMPKHDEAAHDAV